MPTDIAQTIINVLVVGHRVEVLVVLTDIVASLDLMIESDFLCMLTASLFIRLELFSINQGWLALDTFIIFV